MDKNKGKLPVTEIRTRLHLIMYGMAFKDKNDNMVDPWNAGFVGFKENGTPLMRHSETHEEIFRIA